MLREQSRSSSASATGADGPPSGAGLVPGARSGLAPLTHEKSNENAGHVDHGANAGRLWWFRGHKPCPAILPPSRNNGGDNQTATETATTMITAVPAVYQLLAWSMVDAGLGITSLALEGSRESNVEWVWAAAALCMLGLQAVGILCARSETLSRPPCGQCVKLAFAIAGTVAAAVLFCVFTVGASERAVVSVTACLLLSSVVKCVLWMRLGHAAESNLRSTVHSEMPASEVSQTPGARVATIVMMTRPVIAAVVALACNTALLVAAFFRTECALQVGAAMTFVAVLGAIAVITVHFDQRPAQGPTSVEHVMSWHSWTCLTVAAYGLWIAHFLLSRPAMQAGTPEFVRQLCDILMVSIAFVIFLWSTFGEPEPVPTDVKHQQAPPTLRVLQWLPVLLVASLQTLAVVVAVRHSDASPDSSALLAAMEEAAFPVCLFSLCTAGTKLFKRSMPSWGLYCAQCVVIVACTYGHIFDGTGGPLQLFFVILFEAVRVKSCPAGGDASAMGGHTCVATEEATDPNIEPGAGSYKPPVYQSPPRPVGSHDDTMFVMDVGSPASAGLQTASLSSPSDHSVIHCETAVDISGLLNGAAGTLYSKRGEHLHELAAELGGCVSAMQLSGIPPNKERHVHDALRTICNQLFGIIGCLHARTPPIAHGSIDASLVLLMECHSTSTVLLLRRGSPPSSAVAADADAALCQKDVKDAAQLLLDIGLRCGQHSRSVAHDQAGKLQQFADEYGHDMKQLLVNAFAGHLSAATAALYLATPCAQMHYALLVARRTLGIQDFIADEETATCDGTDSCPCTRPGPGPKYFKWVRLPILPRRQRQAKAEGDWITAYHGCRDQAKVFNILSEGLKHPGAAAAGGTKVPASGSQGIWLSPSFEYAGLYCNWDTTRCREGDRYHSCIIEARVNVSQVGDTMYNTVGLVPPAQWTEQDLPEYGFSYPDSVIPVAVWIWTSSEYLHPAQQLYDCPRIDSTAKPMDSTACANRLIGIDF